MDYIALYWHITCLYFRRFILKKDYQVLAIQKLDLPVYTEQEHLYKANTIWKILDKNMQVQLIETSARLQESPIYISLVEEKRIEVKYLPLINALSEGITRLLEDGIDYNFASNQNISYLKRGLEELTFFQDALFLVRHWILPYSLYKVFENYIGEYNYYGGMDVKVERQGEETKIKPLFYNLTAGLLHIHDQHPQLLDVYWQAIKGRGFSDFYKTKYHIPFLTNQQVFEEKIRQVFPIHSAIKTVDYTLSFDDFIKDYEVLLPNDFLDKYQFKNLSLVGNVYENNFIKLLELIEKLEKQQIYPRTYINEKFGIPYIKIADSYAYPRAKVYLKSEIYQKQAIFYKGQTARFTAIFVGFDDTGFLIFEKGILYL